MATARISSTNAFPSSPLAAGAISVVAAANLLDVTTDAPVTGRAAATGTDTLFHFSEAVLGGAWRARARAEESDAGGMAWWRIGLPYSALVRLEFRAREGKPPMKNDSDRDRGRAVECGVGAAEQRRQALRLERERDEEEGGTE
jgi:hypothetical protein